MPIYIIITSAIKLNEFEYYTNPLKIHFESSEQNFFSLCTNEKLNYTI